MLIKLSSASRQLVLQKNMMFLICITGQDPDGDYSAATYFFNIISNEWTRGKVAIFKLALLETHFSWTTKVLFASNAIISLLGLNQFYSFNVDILMEAKQVNLAFRLKLEELSAKVSK